MASLKNLKDQRRAELIIPYRPTEQKAEDRMSPFPPLRDADVYLESFSETLGTALPMAAMFTRHKMIGWTAVVFAIQSWLNESPAQVAAGKQPGYFAVGMALMSLMLTYMPIFFPTASNAATGTGPAAPVAA